MTKLRLPGSVEAAMVTIAEAIGWPLMASASRRKQGTLRAWSDPDKPELPTLNAAFLLDQAYDRATGRGWPIADAYARMVVAARSPCCGSPDALARHTAAVIREGGEAHGSLIDAFVPGATRADRCEAVADLIQAAVAIDRAIPALMHHAQAQSP